MFYLSFPQKSLAWTHDVPQGAMLLLRNTMNVPLFYGEYVEQTIVKRSGQDVALGQDKKQLKKDFIMVKCIKMIPKNTIKNKEMLTPSASKMPLVEAVGELVDWPCSCISYEAAAK